MADEVNDLVGIAPFIVVPGADLDKLVGQGDAGLGVENRGTGIGIEVGGNDRLIGVAEDALQLALGSLLHGVADFLIGGGLGEVAGQVNDRNIGRRDAQRHAGQLAVEFGDDLADSLGGAGGRRDDVVSRRTAAAPILGGDAVNRLLGGGDGMDRGHEALSDAPVVVQDLGQRSQAVGGAGSVGNKVHIAGVLILVDAHDEHRGIVLGGGAHNDLLGAGGEMALRLFLGQEQAGGFDDIFSADLAPGQIFFFALAENSDLAAIDDQGMIGVGNFAVKLAVDRVILEHISHIIRRDEVVDADNFNIGMRKTGAENQTADAAKTIDTNFNHDYLQIVPAAAGYQRSLCGDL